jgi:DNA-binding NarL/FixJ family response regulator
MKQHVCILIIDDQGPIRQGLQALLAAWPEIEVVGIGTNGAEAVQAAGQCQPDVALIDIQKSGPYLKGTDPQADLEAIRLIKSRWPKIRLVVLTMYTTHRAAALAAGADAFLLKGCTAEMLRDALLPSRPVAPPVIPPELVNYPLPAAS